MASEITRIANATDYNGIHLLNGNLSSDTHDGSKMSATGKLKVHFGTANDSAEDYYYIQIGTSTASALGVGNQATGTDGITVSTQEAAQKALVAINNAVVSKDKIRASLGALQNRLENTISNLSTQTENLQAAESRISDVDVATEMTKFVRNQILTQSAVAMGPQQLVADVGLNFHQRIPPPLFDLVWHLIGKGCSLRTVFRLIGEHPHVLKAAFFHKAAQRLKVFFGFAGVAHNKGRAQGGVGQHRTNSVEHAPGVASKRAPHTRQHVGVRVLQGDIQIRQQGCAAISDKTQQLRRNAAGVEVEQAQPRQPVKAHQFFEQARQSVP